MVCVVQAGQQDMDRVADIGPEMVGKEDESWKVEEDRDTDVGLCRCGSQWGPKSMRQMFL